jgi:hypothetical protein
MHTFVYNNEAIEFDLKETPENKYILCENEMFVEVFPFGIMPLSDLDSPDLKNSDFFCELLRQAKRYLQ